MANISPLQLARAIQQAIAYRASGMAQYVAAEQSCRTVGISSDWAMIIHLSLDTGYSLVEDWCERITKDALDRAYTGKGDFR